jgi:ParB family transcriptional regulator, chromosome partitioning protein
MPDPATNVPETVGVKTIQTRQLHPNPHNPRMLFDKAPLDTLRRSIEKVGILVPLTVYWSKSQRNWVILDGQRRWMCAQDLGLKTLPANQVAEPSLVQNIVTMFQIHKLREDWELMPTALKLQVLIEALKERRDKQLADLTGLDQAVVVRCKKLLSYPKKYQDMMLVPDPDQRIKADFFIELYPVLRDRNVRAMEWFRPERFTAQMLQRYESGHLTAVTDFRKVKQHINVAVEAGRTKAVTDRLREFAEQPELPVEHLAIQSAAVAAKVQQIEKATKALAQLLQRMNAGDFYGEDKLWVQLEQLVDLIRLRLGEVERRPK